MHKIEQILIDLRIPYGWATQGRRPARSHNAAMANGVNALIPAGVELAFVECRVLGLIPARIIDHHNEGDAGYGMPPERFYEGSSLGQVLALFGLAPTAEQLIIAAADHCLMHAYRGACPGVDPGDLEAWRVRSRALSRGLSEQELRRQIDAATDLLTRAPRIQVAGTDVAWFDDVPKELSEASARTGIPYAYLHPEKDGRMKSGIRSAPPEVVATWIRECGLKNIYGDPQRGFAGGYF